MLNDFYDESEPLVKLEMFYGPKKHIVDKCIVMFSLPIHDYILKNYECTKIAEIGGSNGNVPVWSFEYKGEKIAFYLSHMGSSLAGDMFFETNHLTGATKFIMFGSCGSLDNDKTNGKFIIPTEAYRGEGFSFYFRKPSDYIKIKNAEVLSKIFDELNIPYVMGKTWTVECMFRETTELFRKRKEEGCIAVEMEVSGIQALCDYYGFELYDFLSSGDVLAEDNYDIAKLRDANHNIDKFQIALQIIERI